MHNLRQIEKLVKRPFETMHIPSGSEICGKQLFHWVKKLETVATEHQEIEKFLPVISEKLASLDREELLRRVVSLEFDRFLDDYRDGEEIHSPREGNEDKSGKGRKEKGRDFSGKYARLFINLGKTDGFYPEQLIELVNRNTQGKKVPLGRIDLMKTFSFFEVDQEYSDFLINALNKSKFNDRRVSVEIAQEKGDRDSDGRDRPAKKAAKRSDRKPDRNRGDKAYKKSAKRDKKKFSR